MPKVRGKDLEFWWDGIEIPVIEANLSAEFEELDGTDSATPGDGKDTEVGFANRGFTISGNLYTPDGAEIATGTLVKGNRYRVTAKDTVLAAYDIGQLFEAAGTEVMSATDKVVPLGNKITGKTIDFTFNAVQIPVTSIDYNVNYDELDATDSETTGDGRETEVSRASRATAINGIVRQEDADVLTTNPVKQAATLTFNTNNKAEGDIIPVSKNPVDNNLDYAKIAYAFRWVGNPTETNLGLAAAIEKAFKIILKRGATTNKEYTGNAIVISKGITLDINSLAKVSYTIKINGALTEAVAN
jgi:hypothetical protein